jgi:hypothetical protein
MGAMLLCDVRDGAGERERSLLLSRPNERLETS